MILPREVTDEKNRGHSDGEFEQFVWLQFKPQTVRRLNIPSVSYPIKKSSLNGLIGCGGVISIPDIMRGLMGWMDVADDLEPIFRILQQILREHFPPSQDLPRSCNFRIGTLGESRFRLDPMQADQPSVGWHRRQWVIAMGCASKIEPGILNIAAPRPVTLETARSILHHTETINWEGLVKNLTLALTSTKGVADCRSWAAGEANLTYFENGYQELQRCRLGDPEGDILLPLPPVSQRLAPNQIAAMVAIGNYFL